MMTTCVLDVFAAFMLSPHAWAHALVCRPLFRLSGIGAIGCGH